MDTRLENTADATVRLAKSHPFHQRGDEGASRPDGKRAAQRAVAEFKSLAIELTADGFFSVRPQLVGFGTA